MIIPYANKTSLTLYLSALINIKIILKFVLLFEF